MCRVSLPVLTGLPSLTAQDPAACMADASCYSHLFDDGQLRLLPDEGAALALVLSQPHTYDAVVVFDMEDSHPEQTDAPAAEDAPQAVADGLQGAVAVQGLPSSAPDSRGLVSSRGLGGEGQVLLGQLGHYTLRMNHSDVPSTRFLLDLFDVYPAEMNGLDAWKHNWFFTNLQVRVQGLSLWWAMMERQNGGRAGRRCKAKSGSSPHTCLGCAFHDVLPAA